MALNFAELSLYQKILGGGAPASAASPTGDISAMVKHLVSQFEDPQAATADANGSVLDRLAYLQSITPLSAGIVRNMRDWAGGSGYEFWWGNLHDDLSSAAAATNPSGLDGWGWVTPSATTEVVTGDLFSESDDGNNSWQPSSGTSWRSPQIFGGADGYRMAQIFLRQAPTKLVCEWYAKWTSTPTTNTLASYIGGMASGNPASADAAGSAGLIVSDGTNFRLVSDNGNDAGAAIDANLHLWRIEFAPAPGVTEWFIDDVSQGTITTETDIWPTNFAVRRDAAGNIPAPMFGRVYYAV